MLKLNDCIVLYVRVFKHTTKHASIHRCAPSSNDSVDGLA